MLDKGYEIVSKYLCCCEWCKRKGRKAVAMHWFVNAQLCRRFVLSRKWENRRGAHHQQGISSGVKREEGFKLEFGSASLCPVVAQLAPSCVSCVNLIYTFSVLTEVKHYAAISGQFLLLCSLTLLWIIRSVLLLFDITEMNHFFQSR